MKTEKNTFKKILNIAAGKMLPINLEFLNGYFLVNLDHMYYDHVTPQEIEQAEKTWLDHKRIVQYCNENAYTFLERSRIQFDEIVIYRFLEHVKKTDILYFIYLMSTALRIGGEIDCIVPNYKVLAQRILEEDVTSIDFEAEDIITTYELLNEVNNPHASVWTIDRVKHFFTLEKRFKIVEHYENFNFDGRDIYLRFRAIRVK